MRLYAIKSQPETQEPASRGATIGGRPDAQHPIRQIAGFEQEHVDARQLHNSRERISAVHANHADGATPATARATGKPRPLALGGALTWGGRS